MDSPHDFEDFAVKYSPEVMDEATPPEFLRLKLLDLACMSPPQKTVWKPLPDQKQRQAQAGRDGKAKATSLAWGF